MNNSLQGWKEVELQDVLTSISNGTTSKQNENKRGFKVTRIETISKAEINLNKTKYVELSEKDYNKFKLNDGDILFSHINSTKHIGKTAIYNSEMGILIHGMNLLRLVPNKEKIVPKFLLYLLKNRYTLAFFQTRCKKSVNQSSLDQRTIKKFKFIIPSLQTQEKVVSILEKVEKIKHWRQESEKLTDYYLKSVFLEMFGDPIKNPKSWKIVRLDELCDEDSRITYGIVQPGREFESGIPIVRSVDLTENFVSLENLKRVDPQIESGYPRSRLKGRELLISVRGTLGPVAIASSGLKNSNVSRGVAVVNTNSEVKVEYLLFLFKTAAFQQRIATVSKGIALKQLNLNELRKFRIPLPDLYLQEKFAKIVEAVEKLKDRQKKSRHQIDDLHNASMQKAFKGELSC